MANSLIGEALFSSLPGNANQGAILITRDVLGNPPFNQGQLEWLNMEEVIGVANIKVEYNEQENKYVMYKGKGHRDNLGEWIYDWEEVQTWNGLTPETQEALQSLLYVAYRFDITEAHRFKVYGTKKDGTEELLLDLSYATYEELVNETTRATVREDELEVAVETESERAVERENQIETNLNNEITRATTREDELEVAVETESERAVEREDEIEDKVNNLINDTVITTDKTWSSSKIAQELISALHYKGQVASKSNLPTTGQAIGDLYNVEDTGDNYCWNGSSWDKLSGDYIGGHGITILGKNIAARGNNNQGININANGIGVKVDGSSVKFDSQGRLYVDPQQVTDIKEGDGIAIYNDNTINVKVDATSIGINANNELENLYELEGGIATEVDSNNKVNVIYNSTNLKVNASNQLDTVLQIWNGTQTEYDAIATKDANTLYLINEEV